MHNAVGKILTNGRRVFVVLQVLIRSIAQSNIQVLLSFLSFQVFLQGVIETCQSKSLKKKISGKYFCRHVPSNLNSETWKKAPASPTVEKRQEASQTQSVLCVRLRQVGSNARCSVSRLIHSTSVKSGAM